MTNDPIGAMLTTLRNGILRRAVFVLVKRSKINEAILHIIEEAGYIDEISPVKENNIAYFKVGLRTSADKPSLRTIRRLSKPGLRRYAKAQNIPNPLGGYGLIVISTPKGVMSGRDARQKGLGGELLCEIT